MFVLFIQTDVLKYCKDQKCFISQSMNESSLFNTTASLLMQGTVLVFSELTAGLKFGAVPNVSDEEIVILLKSDFSKPCTYPYLNKFTLCNQVVLNDLF